MKHVYPALFLILLCLNVSVAAPPETLLRELDFRDVQVEYLDPHPYHVYEKGEAIGSALLVKNEGRELRELQLVIGVTPFGLQPLPARQAKLTLRPNEAHQIQVGSLLQEVTGHGTLEFYLIIDGDSSDTAEVAFAHMPSAGPPVLHPGTMRFGIGYGAGGGEDLEAELMARVGFNVVRLNPWWTKIQKNGPEEWNIDWYDRQVAAHTSRGMELQAIIHGIPGWARMKSEDGSGNIPEPEAWKAWVERIATHLKGTAKYWELWNEPDIGFFKGTVDEYLRVFSDAAEVIRRVDPETKVMTGGFASINHGSYKEGIIERTVGEASEYFDIFCYHRHGYFERFFNEMEDQILPLLRRRMGDVPPLYFSETSMDARFGENHQAQTAVKKMAYAWSLGSVAYTWFNYADKTGGEEANRPGRTYGLLTNDHYPKPSLVAINTFIRHLQKGRFIESWATPELQFAFLFENEGKFILVAWNERKHSPGAEIVLSHAGEGAQVVDIMGRSQPLPTQEGMAEITLKSDARFFVFQQKPQHESIRNAKQIAESLDQGQTMELPRAPRATSISLASASDIFNFFEDDPHTIDRLWQGPEDLAADLRMTWSEGLHVEVTVQDDSWEPMPRRIESGDSLQLIIVGPFLRGEVNATLHEGGVIENWEGEIRGRVSKKTSDSGRIYHVTFSEEAEPRLEQWLREGKVELEITVRDRDDGHLATLARTAGANELNPPLLLKLASQE